MPDPVLLAIAAAVAAKSTEAVVDGGRGAVAALVRLVRSRFGGSTAADDPVRAAAIDLARREELALALGRAVAADQDFGDRLRAAWAAASVEINATAAGHVTNTFSGAAAGPVVQARDIRGDVRF